VGGIQRHRALEGHVARRVTGAEPRAMARSDVGRAAAERWAMIGSGTRRAGIGCLGQERGRSRASKRRILGPQ